MAISKKEKEQEAPKSKIKVTRVKQWDNGNISFDMELCEVITIYGMAYMQGKKKDGTDYAFCSFPQRKGSDGKYYNHCYFKITEEMQSDIEKQIESLL